MQRDRLPYILIPAVAFLAILPLILQGCSCGHDFDFHILNWLEAARQFTHGNLHPHWAYTAAYNAGEPRFVFYPPLSWTIGAILGLVFPWTWTPIIYTWLALTASGLTLHRLAREFTTPTAALLAAAFYVVNPYMLFTAYERTAYAELLAAAWIPLLVYAILREKVTIPRIAIPVALLWLTNAPAAVMSCYALALLTLIRIITVAKGTLRNNTAANSSPQTPLQLTLNTITGTLLGLGLASFYVIPAAYERRYVQIEMAILPGLRIQDNFLFHHTGELLHDQVLHTASLIALILIAATFIVLATRRLSSKAALNPTPSTSALIPITILTIAITLLLTPITTIFWNHLPELAFLQFPWRLLAILAVILSLSIALASHNLNLKQIPKAALAIAIAAALIYPAYSVFRQPCDEEDTVQGRQALFHSNQGTDPTDEYTPITADNDSLSHTNPPYWLSPDPDAKAPANTTPGPAPTNLTLNSPTPQTLILNVRDYPTWRITLNQAVITPHEQRDDGLIAIPIPAVPSAIKITYARPTDQILGNTISLVSIALLVLTFRRRAPFTKSI
jgi:hypothetical protein